MMIGFLLSHTALNLMMFLTVIVGSWSLLKRVPYAPIRYFVFTPLLGIATVALCFNAVLNSGTLVDAILDMNVHSPAFMKSMEPSDVSRLSSFLYVFSNLSFESLFNIALMIVGISLAVFVLASAITLSSGNKKTAFLCALMAALLFFLGDLFAINDPSHHTGRTTNAPAASHSAAIPIAPPKTLTPKPFVPPVLPVTPPKALPHSLHAEKNPMTLPNPHAPLLSLAASFIAVLIFSMTERKRIFPWPMPVKMLILGGIFSTPFLFLNLLIHLFYECVAQRINTISDSSFSDFFFILALPSAMLAGIALIALSNMMTSFQNNNSTKQHVLSFFGIILLPVCLTGLFLYLSANILMRGTHSPVPQPTHSIAAPKQPEALPALPDPLPKAATTPEPSLPTQYEDDDGVTHTFIPAPSIGVVKEQQGATSSPEAQVSTIVLSRKVTENSPRKTAHFAKASSEEAYGYRISAHQIADGWIITYAIHARQTPLQSTPAQATLLQGSVFLPFTDDGVNISDNGTVYARVLSSDPAPSENTEAGDQALADSEPDDSDVKDDPSSLDTAPQTEAGAPHEKEAKTEALKADAPVVKNADQQAASSKASAHEASATSSQLPQPPQSQSERENQIALKRFLEDHTLGQ